MPQLRLNINFQMFAAPNQDYNNIHKRDLYKVFYAMHAIWTRKHTYIVLNRRYAYDIICKSNSLSLAFNALIK